MITQIATKGIFAGLGAAVSACTCEGPGLARGLRNAIGCGCKACPKNNTGAQKFLCYWMGHPMGWIVAGVGAVAIFTAVKK